MGVSAAAKAAVVGASRVGTLAVAGTSAATVTAAEQDAAGEGSIAQGTVAEEMVVVEGTARSAMPAGRPLEPPCRPARDDAARDEAVKAAQTSAR